MARRIITREIKERVYDEIQRLDSDEVTVDFVVEILRTILIYDPQMVEEQWYRDRARRLLAQRRDESGVRIMFAAQKASRGVYINIETCKDLSKVREVVINSIWKESELFIWKISCEYGHENLQDGKEVDPETWDEAHRPQRDMAQTAPVAYMKN